MEDNVLIGFSTKKRLLGAKLIRFFTSSDFSHAFVIMGTLCDTLILSESAIPITRLSPITKYFKEDVKLEIWQIHGIDPEKILKAKKDLLRRPEAWYGIAQIVGFLWVFLFKLFGIRKQNPFTDGEVCSEHVDAFLKFVGYPPSKDFNKDSVTPDDILTVLRNDSNCKKVAYCEYGMKRLEWM